MFTLICARINSWVNNREAGDLRRHRAHYDVILMIKLEQSVNHVHISYRMPYIYISLSNITAQYILWRKKSIWGLQSWSTINTTSRMCFKSLYIVIYLTTVLTLQWLHNERDGVPNHRSLDFLLNRLFRRRSKKTPKAPRHWPLLVCCMSWLWYNYTYMECIGLYFRYNWPIKSTKPGTDILIPVYFIWLCERNICQVIGKKSHNIC